MAGELNKHMGSSGVIVTKECVFMQILERNSAGVFQISAEAKLLDERKIFIEGELNDESASLFFKQMLLLNKKDQESLITIIIDSPGGVVQAGLVMLDIMLGSKAPVRTVCVNRAYSMAAVLFACGAEERWILPQGRIMLHQPLIGGQIEGNSSTILSLADTLVATKEKVNTILSKRTGKTLEEIEEATSYDHYFSAQEALAYNLADRICAFYEIVEG